MYVKQSIALDPRYGSRKTREFMTGGLAGQVVLNSRVSPSLWSYSLSSVASISFQFEAQPKLQPPPVSKPISFSCTNTKHLTFAAQ